MTEQTEQTEQTEITFKEAKEMTIHRWKKISVYLGNTPLHLPCGLCKLRGGICKECEGRDPCLKLHNEFSHVLSKAYTIAERMFALAQDLKEGVKQEVKRR